MVQRKVELPREVQRVEPKEVQRKVEVPRVVQK